MVSKHVKRSLKYLEKHKGLFGLEDYTMMVQDKTGEMRDFIAEADADWYEKTFTVTIYKKYVQREDWKKTLIHELIHGRIGLAQERAKTLIDKIIYEFEEECVNDITDGFMVLLDEH